MKHPTFAGYARSVCNILRTEYGIDVLKEQSDDIYIAYHDGLSIWETAQRINNNIEEQIELTNEIVREIISEEQGASNADNGNQCDGCRQGLPVVDGIHRTLEDRAFMGCTRKRYSSEQGSEQFAVRDPLQSSISGAHHEN